MKDFSMKIFFIMGILCGFFAPCFAAGESIAIAIEMKSSARMQLALENLQIHNEKIDGTAYVNRLADNWYADTAWWKQVIACGAALMATSRVVLGASSLKYIDKQRKESNMRLQTFPMGKEWYGGYAIFCTSWTLVSVGIVAGWYATCDQSKRTYIELTHLLLISPMVTIEQDKLTSRARALLDCVYRASAGNVR